MTELVTVAQLRRNPSSSPFSSDAQKLASNFSLNGASSPFILWLSKLRRTVCRRPVLASVLLFLLIFIINKVFNKRVPPQLKENKNRLDEVVGGDRPSSQLLENTRITTENKQEKKNIHEESSDEYRLHHSKPSHSKALAAVTKRKKVPLPSLIVLVGIPGSGKTTWAQKYKQTVRTDAIILSSDDIRLELMGTVKDRNREDEVRTIILQRVLDIVATKRTVIVDDCVHNLDPIFREELLKIVEHKRYETVLRKFALKPIFAEARIQSDVVDGKSRYIPSFPELEKAYELYCAAEASVPMEAWEKIKA